MLVPRHARPRYRLDDSWLFADPMTIVMDDGAVEDACVDGGLWDGDVIASQCDLAVNTTDEPAQRTPAGFFNHDLRAIHGQPARIAGLARRGRWFVLVGVMVTVIILAGALMRRSWPAPVKIDSQAASNAPALAKLRCGDAAERRTSSLTL